MNERHPLRQRRWLLAVMAVLFVVVTSAIVALSALAPAASVTLSVGQVAPVDVLAPSSISYESEVLTQLAKQSASDSVREVYDPPNPAILRQQVQLARRILNYIDNVRHDTYGTLDQRLDDLRAISGLNLNDEIYGYMLSATDKEWSDIDAQVIALLERTMRDPIRADNLQDVLARVPNLVSISANDLQSAVIVPLVRALITPNAFVNEERTRAARKAASDAVQPVTRSFLQGQVVVRAGTIVRAEDVEALTKLRLLLPADQRVGALVGALMAVTLVMALGAAYLRRFHRDLFEDMPRIIFIGSIFLIFLAGARLMNAQDPFIARLYPAAALALIVVAVTEARAVLAISAAFAALIGIMSNTTLEQAVLVGTGCAAGVLTLSRTERLNSYFVAGLVIAGVNIISGILFALLDNSLDASRVLIIIPSGVVSGLLSAGLGLVGLYLTSSLLNLPTSLKMLELSQPSQPLLQRLLREAPGTYQHSLQVANLAELAAEQIGANAAIVRVGALYHDIGKMHAPLYFVENQVDGVTPHDRLNPRESARIIIAHVTEGEKLARKNRLPKALIDFILQHHGTTRTEYFYRKALEAADGDDVKVNPSLFTYPGPIPQTRESAILMLADASESTVRAKRPRTKEEIAQTVNEIIQARQNDGQLDDSGLTLSDLKVIREAFVSSLQGMFHPRLHYPAARDTQSLSAVGAARSTSESNAT